MANVAHRSAGTPGTDTLQSATQRAQVIKFIQSIDASTQPIAPAPASTLTLTSAAWDIGARLAPDSLASGYGTRLATQATSPTSTPLPVSLGGTTVSVVDSAGVMRLAQLFFTGPEQVNFVMPGAAANGTAQVSVASRSGATATGTATIAAVAPSIFRMPGSSVAAAIAIRVAAGGAQTTLNVFQCSGPASCSATPLDLGATTDTTVVVFFGTGLRKAAQSNVRATIGGVDAPVLFSGAQGEFVGLDQINVQLPQSLQGRGEASVVFSIDGQQTNPVTINVR
jgi:uncharacterized protein (TIGR03437 family)